MKDIRIDGNWIGPAHPPYIVAEMSANHNGSLDRALAIVQAAKEAGAHAVKLQTYRADTMTFDIDHPRFRVGGDNPWSGDHLYELYEKAYTPWEWHADIFEYGRKLGISIFSSPFDAAAVDLLQKLEAPAYKIASFELVDHDLIRRCAATAKPMIISTGMASLIEISEGVAAARDGGATDIVVLKCTSAYPAPPDVLNLKTIPHLSQALGVHVGLSDHTMGVGAAVASVALGAVLIEKHFTLARSDGGVDSSFSLEPSELKSLVDETRTAHLALGEVSYTAADLETSFRKYRRSLFFVRDVPAGKTVSSDDVQALRPGTPVTWDVFA
jgi:N-acetylneuraminate synthase